MLQQQARNVCVDRNARDEGTAEAVTAGCLVFMDPVS